MLPTLLTLSLNVLYTRQPVGYLLAFLFGLVILMAWTGPGEADRSVGLHEA